MNCKVFSALLVALVLVLMPVLAVASVPPSHTLAVSGPHQPAPHRVNWLLVSLAALGVAGTVTQTYAYPVSGTTPPTQIQASLVQVVTASVNFADADTTAVVTHNFNLGTTNPFQMNTGQLFPEVIVNWSSAGTAFPAIGVALTNGNIITLAKGNTTTGSGGTATVVIRRPHSAGQ